MSTAEVALDRTQYVRVNVGLTTILLQSHRDSVRVVMSDDQPILANTAFHLLGDSDTLTLPHVNTNVWALAMSVTSRLIVTELTNPLTTSVGTGGDFFAEVAKGNVPGHSLRGVVTKNENVGTDFVDIWGGSVDMVYPISAETWEIVSDSTDDSALGVGARTVLVNSLDADYNEQSQIVTLNGTTPVTLSGTHYRPDNVTVTTAGSGMSNVGQLILRSTAGLPRNYVPPGGSASVDAHITVPAGKTYYLIQVLTFLAKDSDGAVTTRFRFFGANTPWIALGSLPYYQAAFGIKVEALVAFPEKTDIRYQAKLSIGGAEANQIAEFLIVENNA